MLYCYFAVDVREGEREKGSEKREREKADLLIEIVEMYMYIMYRL